MTHQWQKLGLLYCPREQGNHPKLLSHAANPLPVFIEDNLYRIFYSGRDADNRSSVGAVDVDIARRVVIREHEFPFFMHGPEGSFYADGVSIGCCYQVNGVQYMLFMGWQNSTASHWRGDIGRLIVHSDLTLELDRGEPLLGSSKIDPISLSYPCVMSNAAGGYNMWYGSTKMWDAGNGEMLHVINQASSFDGHDWIPEGLAGPYEPGGAQVFSKPSVVQNSRDGGYAMWFSYRSGKGETYRIGYAMSEDGKHWVVKNEDAGIDISRTGWDSEMIEYPHIFDHKGQRYMLYNGNGYSKSGFGLAILIDD